MDWSAATLWWVAAGVLLAVEMATGTYYLLMVALGCVAGALSAHAGWSTSTQLVATALLGGGATVAWHLKRMRSPNAAPAASNRDVNLDIGGSVQVTHWLDGGRTEVHYRGATWQASFAGPGTPAPGTHIIVAVQGSQLSLAPAAPR